MQSKSLLELVRRLNEIEIEQNKLDIEHNQIVEELYKRLPPLRDDVNIQPKVRVKK